MQSSSSSTPSVYMGASLRFRFDERNATLDIILPDGNTVSVYDQTVEFAFDSQQSSVQLIFSPVDSSYLVEAACIDPSGHTTTAQYQGSDAVITIGGPPSIGDSFQIMLANGDTTTSARAQSGPGARLQTRLVFTTVEPPDDPDAGPIILTSSS